MSKVDLAAKSCFSGFNVYISSSSFFFSFIVDSTAVKYPYNACTFLLWIISFLFSIFKWFSLFFIFKFRIFKIKIYFNKLNIRFISYSLIFIFLFFHLLNCVNAVRIRANLMLFLNNLKHSCKHIIYISSVNV